MGTVPIFAGARLDIPIVHAKARRREGAVPVPLPHSGVSRHIERGQSLVTVPFSSSRLRVKQRAVGAGDAACRQALSAGAGSSPRPPQFKLRVRYITAARATKSIKIGRAHV